MEESVFFADGVCPACGSITYGYTREEPMHCSRCGWTEPPEEAEKRIFQLEQLLDQLFEG